MSVRDEDNERTPRQNAINSILLAEGPAKLFEILSHDPASRDATIPEILFEQSLSLERGGQVGAAGHLQEVVRVFRATFSLIEKLSEVKTREQLLTILEESTIVWVPTFQSFVEQLISEPSAVSASKASGLRCSLDLLRELEDGRLVLSQMKPDEAYEVIKNSGVLRDRLFHRYLILFADIMVVDEIQAGVWRRLVGGLAESCRVIDEAEAKSQYIPITFDEAAAWFVLPPWLDIAVPIAASLMLSGEVPPGDILQRFVALRQGNATLEEYCFVSSQFLENACRVVPAGVQLFLSEMREILNLNVEWSDRSYPTHILHYAMSLLPRWRRLPSKKAVLQDAENLLASAIPLVDRSRGPRLIRDLHWQRGQILQNLAHWDLSCIASAVREFRCALNTPERLQHEHVPRAIISVDLANALTQLHRAEGTMTEAVEREQEGLYELASKLLGASEEPLRRAIALGNIAIFYNERVSGDLGLNQEIALEKIDEALYLIEKEDIENEEKRTLKAGFLNVRGNVLLSRLYGDFLSITHAAIDAYSSALNECGSDDWLKGAIQLNRGNAYLRSTTTGRENALSAYYAFSEARTLFAEFPVDAARALAGQASAMYLREEERDVAFDMLREAIAEYEQLGARDGLPSLHRRLGLWCMRRSNSSRDFGEAAERLMIASELYVKQGRAPEGAQSALSASKAFFSAGRLDESAASAQRSIELADAVWKEASSSEDRIEFGEIYAAGNAQYLWCRSHSELSTFDAWTLAGRSKFSEIRLRTANLPRDYSTLDLAVSGLQVRSRAGLAQRRRIQFEDVSADVSLAPQIRAALESSKESEEMLALLTSKRPELDTNVVIDELLNRYSELLLIDVVVAESGTVLLLRDGIGTEIVKSSFTRDDLLDLSASWHSAYRARGENPLLWESGVAKHMETVGHVLLEPVISRREPEWLKKARVVFFPGLLIGKPLHSASCSGVAFLDLVADVAYAFNAQGLFLEGHRPQSALCLLSDNADPPKQLPSAPRELADVVSTLLSSDVAASIIAKRGALNGLDVFADAGVPIPSEAAVLKKLPTPQTVLELVSSYDLIFYTGHGIGDGQQALVLCDEEGEEALLSTLDLFGAKDMSGKIVLLSACETAYETAFTGAEPDSVVAALVQLGVSFLLGTGWVARDRSAHILFRSFCRELPLCEWDCIRAFRRALEELRSAGVPLSDWSTFMPFVGSGRGLRDRLKA